MGQAAVDLPDPLEAEQASAAPGGVDDLLAQLAGDEIDRLLAEADEDAGGAPVAPSALDDLDDGEVAALEAADAEIAEDLRRTEAAAAAAIAEDIAAPAASPAATESPPTPLQVQEAAPADLPAAATAPTPAAANATGSDDSAEPATALFPAGAVEKVLTEDTAGRSSSAEPTATATPPAEAAPGAEADSEARAAERGALGEAPADPAGAVDAASITSRALAHQDAHADEIEDDAPLPILLRPLGWLSAPLNGAPDWVRETIGKVAIVTLVNAVAVIAYVMLFRAKH